jgi:hypothetical protein
MRPSNAESAKSLDDTIGELEIITSAARRQEKREKGREE